MISSRARQLLKAFTPWTFILMADSCTQLRAEADSWIPSGHSMQIIRNRTQYDVCVIGSGAGGGMAAMVLTRGRRQRGDARGGPDVGRQPRHRHVQVALPDAAARRRHARAALRRVRRGARRLVARRRALHDGARQPVRLVPIADARRPHQSLGPHLAALRAGRLPPQEHRRPRRRLADHLRRHQAVLRQDRPVHRHLRRQPAGLPERARRHLPAAAGAALLRAADQAGAARS